jgi:hypothetical protein
MKTRVYLKQINTIESVVWLLKQLKLKNHKTLSYMQAFSEARKILNYIEPQITAPSVKNYKKLRLVHPTWFII